MKNYPSVLGSTKCPHKNCFAFVKYDGSNLRWEWNPKKGFCKQGTRNHLFDESDIIFGRSIEVFNEKYNDSLNRIFRKYYRNFQEVTAFTEFLGHNSFAGIHDPNDKMGLVLIDIWLYKFGLINPRDFIKNFDSVHKAELIYTGNLNQEFITDVKEGKYNVIEGVVCKGGEGRDHWMRKIKTYEYLRRLKERFSGDWIKYWE